MRSSWLVVWTLLGLVPCSVGLGQTTSTPTAAAAVDAEPPPRWPAPRAVDLRLEGQLGALFSDQAGGVAFNVATFVRLYVLELGVRAGFATQLLETQFGAAVLGGVVFDVVPAIRVDMLGVLGVRRYEDIGADLNFLGTDDPGTSATLGYAGASWSVIYIAASRRSTHGMLGARASIERDLTHVTKRYSYLDDDNWFGGEAEVIMRERKLGTISASLLLTAGVLF